MTREELLQNAKPILFNTEMVTAILDERKTVTRRVVKLPKWIVKQDDGRYTLFADGTCYENKSFIDVATYLNKPYRPGDILYVRETWHTYTKRVGKGESCHLQEFYGYKASIANSEDAHEPWKPSIHMPKKAARIFLQVKDVRVERLQDMRSEDALNEGIKVSQFDLPHTGVLNQFKKLWNSTIKKSDLERYGWEASPWVWVIEFERVYPE